MEKRWEIKEDGNIDDVEYLSSVLGIDTVLANILVQRNIKTFEEARTFFRPSLDDLHDPFLMKDMDLAIERLEAAINNNEKILVYGDYDVDGTTSIALVYLFLKNIYPNIDFYVPDRYSEGYGISYKGIDFAQENSFSLIIALDCGIKAIEKIQYANERNIDFIICDHHLPGDEIPNAKAVLDPKRKDCEYPYKQLSGCGVGFKFLQAYAIKNEIPLNTLFKHLDLVAVSIASDIVPVTGENRILAFCGLQQLNSNPGLGLKTIIRTAGAERLDLTITDIVFKIGPRINAAGRIEKASKSVELLVAQDENFANEMAEKINDFNSQRKDLDSSITEEALNVIHESEELQNKKSTVLFNPEWHKGVIGIVASRLIETYYRPTVVLTESNGIATGSARSVVGFDLYKAIDACSDLLENYGGHMYAAGLSMKTENIPAFQERFEQIVSETITPNQLIPQIEVDAKINLTDITPKFFRIINQLQPFGPDNMTPVFITEDVVDTGMGKIVGKNCDHLKLDIMNPNDKSCVYPAIAFQQAKHYQNIQASNPINICYSVEENSYNGKTNLQLHIRDIKMEAEEN